MKKTFCLFKKNTYEIESFPLKIVKNFSFERFKLKNEIVAFSLKRFVPFSKKRRELKNENFKLKIDKSKINSEEFKVTTLNYHGFDFSLIKFRNYKNILIKEKFNELIKILGVISLDFKIRKGIDVSSNFAIFRMLDAIEEYDIKDIEKVKTLKLEQLYPEVFNLER